MALDRKSNQKAHDHIPDRRLEKVLIPRLCSNLDLDEICTEESILGHYALLGLQSNFQPCHLYLAQAVSDK